MDKTDDILDLVAGYDTYAEADELNVTAASDAPATTVACASPTTLSPVLTAVEGC